MLFSTCQYKKFFFFGLFSHKICLLSLKNYLEFRKKQPKNRELKIDCMSVIMFLFVLEDANQCISYVLRHLWVLFWLPRRCYICVVFLRFLLTVHAGAQWKQFLLQSFTMPAELMPELIIIFINALISYM